MHRIHGPQRAAAPLVFGLMAVLPLSASAQDAVTVDFGLYVQAQYIHDIPEEGDSEGNFLARRVRPIVTGEAYDLVTYRVMLEMNAPVRILDAWIATNLGGVTVSAGQAKIPFGRSWLNSRARLQFVDRSIAVVRFNPDRSPGVWASGFLGGDALEYSAGLFNGDGVNASNVNGDLAEVARLVWTPFGAYPLVESALDFPESPVLAIGGAVLNITVGDEEEAAEALRFNAEAAFKVQGFSAQAEFFTEEREDETGDEFTTNAYYGQAGYVLPSGYEIALRYGAVQPDDAAGPDADETEMTIAASKYFRDHDLKLQADFVNVDRELDDLTNRQLRVQLQLAF